MMQKGYNMWLKDRNLNLNMRDEMTLQTTEDILRLRNLLQQISHVSYSFSKINKDYPIEKLSEEKGREILKVYLNLLYNIRDIWTDFNNLNLNYQNENNDSTA